MRLQRTQINDIFRLVFLCRFTSLGGPLLVLGEAAPTVMQYGMAGFALPTTPPPPSQPISTAASVAGNTCLPNFQLW